MKRRNKMIVHKDPIYLLKLIKIFKGHKKI